MKKLKLFLAAFCLFGLTMENNAQNLILNPGFELGAIPNANDQVPYATDWERGCAGFWCSTCTNNFAQGSPDLFDVRTTTCDVDVPANKWGTRNVRTAGTNRYVGFTGYSNYYGLQYFGESVKGKLSQSLVSGCTYDISFWASAIDGFYMNCGTPNPKTPSVNNKMEVVLRKDGDCTNFKIIYTTGPLTQQTWTQFASTFTLTPAEAAFGYNKVEFRMNNNWAADFGAYSHALYLDDVSLSPQVLTPGVSGPASYCIGSPLTFNGSVTTGTAANHFWEIAESDASGNYISGGYSWSSWYAGNPSGSYTFPSTLPLVCNKYYKVKLALQNACVPWAETSTVFYLNCLPTANAGPDVTICNNGCATIGVDPGFIKYTYYSWTAGAGVIGTSAQITVCPTTTTTYTLTVNNTRTGCSATDVVTVFVVNNIPDFSLSTNLNPGDNFYTMNASPVVTSVSSIAGFGFQWFVDEIVSPTNTTVITGSSASSSCWWSTLNCNFNGYDGPYFTSTSLNPMAGGCTSPSVGHFTAGHTYRITRGTWSDVCPWQQYSVIVYMTHAMAGSASIAVMEDTDAPDYSGQLALSTENSTLENSISVYPNPSNGVFSVELNKAAAGAIEVYDALGNRVQKIMIDKNASGYKIDLSGLAKGIYMLNVISEGQKYSRKIILE